VKPTPHSKAHSQTKKIHEKILGVCVDARRLKQRPDIGPQTVQTKRSSRSDSRTLSGHKAGYIVTEWPHL
jgi:hypothetical protein